MAAGLFIYFLRSRCGLERPSFVGHQQFVNLFQFCRQQTVKLIFQLNRVATTWGSFTRVSSFVVEKPPERGSQCRSAKCFWCWHMYATVRPTLRKASQ